jgi:Icc-related predicted phosphoesterase
MRVALYSDLHLEFKSLFTISTAILDDIDLLLLVGDIHTKTNAIKWIRDQTQQVPVLYVLGNHEYYGESHPHLVDKIRDLTAGTNIHLLENNTYAHGDFLFYGGTMWTDFNLFHNPDIAKTAVQAYLSDYNYIRKSDDNYRRITPDDIQQINRQYMSGLLNFMSFSGDKRKIVLSHHAPTIHSTEDWYKDDLCTAGYINDLENFITFSGIELWCHGHCHKTSDYMVGQTRIVANPYGYWQTDCNINFNSSMVIEL